MDMLIDDIITYLKQSERSYVLADAAPLHVEEKPQRKEVFKPRAIKSSDRMAEKTEAPPRSKERPKREAPKAPTFEQTPIDTHNTVGPDPSMLALLQEVGIDLQAPPSDALAKKRRNAWKDKRFIPAVPIFIMGTEHTPFLQNIQKAIESHFTSSRLINVEKVEQSKKWDAFLDAPVELFIVPDYVISQNATLMKNMKVQKENNTRTLFGKPLLLLPDPTLYMRDPKLKRSLWNVLCQMLQK